VHCHWTALKAELQIVEMVNEFNSLYASGFL